MDKAGFGGGAPEQKIDCMSSIHMWRTVNDSVVKFSKEANWNYKGVVEMENQWLDVTPSTSRGPLMENADEQDGGGGWDKETIPENNTFELI